MKVLLQYTKEHEYCCSIQQDIQYIMKVPSIHKTSKDKNAQGF